MQCADVLSHYRRRKNDSYIAQVLLPFAVIPAKAGIQKIFLILGSRMTCLKQSKKPAERRALVCGIRNQ